ncbi:MAG TPA: recombinase RecA [Actinomycetota bacterium]
MAIDRSAPANGQSRGNEREKALEMALSQIEKHFGKGSIMRLGDNTAVGVDAIPTGALGLDIALGIGGLPRGRIIEIYGPESSGKTSLCLHAVAEAQKLGGIAAFIDAEHALDVVYARNLGVNVDELLVSQPDTGEQALEIADMLVRSGAVDIIVVDSVAALVPRAEIEGEMGDTHVGLQARLMSQALRKLAGNVSRSNAMIVFINQLREKIGVLFGCFEGSSRVALANGTDAAIGLIVDQKLPVEVLSYDPEVGAVVPKKVVGWFDNGPTDEFLEFTVAGAGGRGRGLHRFACTSNHQIRTLSGWQEAQNLAIGDRVMQAVEHRLSPFQWEVILGTLMGDGAISPTTSGHAARLRWGHGVRQAAYCDWKASLFANIGTCRSTNAKESVFHDLSPLPELAELRRAVYFEGRKIFSHDYLKRLTPLSLALWYMDDASFVVRAKGLQERTRDGSGRVDICVEAMEEATQQRLGQYLFDTWGIKAQLIAKGARKVAYLHFPKDETRKLQELIAPYVHPSMEYKLLPRLRGLFGVEPQFVSPRYELLPLPIKSIVRKPSTRDNHRFDIEVEGSHNYFVDGVMVHNSPETTPGGRALKFYASVRLDIRKIENIKSGQEVTGSRVRVKVVKSKVSAPFRQAEFDIQYGHGISKEGSLLDTAAERGIVVKSGSWYLFDGDQIGQGRENAKAFLAEHPDVCDEIATRVKKAVGLVPGDEVEAEADEKAPVFTVVT